MASAFDLSRATCYSMIPEKREINHAEFQDHQLMLFAEAGIKLLLGQSQGDLRPRPRSDFSNAMTYRIFASAIQRPDETGCRYWPRIRSCAWRPMCHKRTEIRLIPATTAIFFRFGFLATNR
jgi:hypothetical protein